MNGMIAIKFVLLVIFTLLGYTLGWFFTTRYDLASKSDLFDFKAFKCRPCLSFHITWVLQVFVSLLFNDFIMLVIGVIFAIILFIGLKLDEKERFYE